MISKAELIFATGYDSFLDFKRHCKRSAPSEKFIGLTRYLYNHGKEVELDIQPEELFMLADKEIAEKKNIAPNKGSRTF